MQQTVEAMVRAFTERADRPPDAMTYHQLQGFLFAVASAPRLVIAPEWMGVVLATHGLDASEPPFEITMAVMAVYQMIRMDVVADRPALPHDCAFRKPPLANFEEDAPMAHWAQGFIDGHQWFRDDWKARLPAVVGEQFEGLLTTLGFFASRPLAEQLCLITKSDLGAAAEAAVDVFQPAMSAYAYFGSSLQRLEPSPPTARSAPLRRDPKVGRNEPCRCGSGRKYKKCCGAAN